MQLKTKNGKKKGYDAHIFGIVDIFLGWKARLQSTFSKFILETEILINWTFFLGYCWINKADFMVMPSFRALQVLLAKVKCVKLICSSCRLFLVSEKQSIILFLAFSRAFASSPSTLPFMCQSTANLSFYYNYFNFHFLFILSRFCFYFTFSFSLSYQPQ